MFAIHRAAATLLVAFGFTDATPNTATLSEAILGDHSSYFERQSGASGVDRLLMWLAVGHGVEGIMYCRRRSSLCVFFFSSQG